MALVYIGGGQYEQALPFATRALETSEKAFGREHEYVAHSLNTTALAYQRLRWMSRALPLYGRALLIAENVEESRSKTLSATVLANVSGLYYAEAKYDQALSLSQRAQSTLEKMEQPNPWILCIALFAQAQSYQALGKYAEALRQYQRILPDHPECVGIFKSGDFVTDGVACAARFGGPLSFNGAIRRSPGNLSAGVRADE